MRVRNITPFSAATPTLGTLTCRAQNVVHQSLVLVLDTIQGVSHLQPTNGPALHGRQLPPTVFTLCDGLFKACDLLRHDAEAMYFRNKRWVVKVFKHSVCLLLPLCLHLEEL